MFYRSSEIDQIVSCRILSFTDIRMGTGQSFGRGAAGAKVCRSGYHSDLSFDPYHITLSLSLSYQLDHITSSMRNIKRFHNINQCKDRLRMKCKSRWKLQGGFFNWASPENVSRLAPTHKSLDWPPSKSSKYENH